jgi:peptide/nickel transport system permease protein
MTLATEAPHADFRLGNYIRNIGIAGLGAIGIAVGLSDMLARAPANAPNIGPALLAPSSQFVFGTDIIGRDMASETLHALAVTATSAGFGAIVTVLCGGLAGFLVARMPFVLGALVRQAVGTLCAVPALFLGILFIGLADRNLAPLAAGLAATPLAFARSFDRARNLVRSRHAEVAQSTGISVAALIRRDLVYEFRDRLVINLARSLADVALILSTVSFLGFGAIPPHRDLGLMIGASRETFFEAWWTAAFPALALIVLILCARLVSTSGEERAS